MFTAENYQLLDFGGGRRLEQFGPLRLDRPCPAAESLEPAEPELWQTALARYERTGRTSGHWREQADLPPQWTVRHGALALELKRTEFGHLGLFPEQADCWDWIAARLGAVGERLQVLNLFGYSGGSTLAAAAAGAQVTHVDAARNLVAWARRNAELSGLASAPVRWIVDDARKFVRRALNRGERYHAVILDPPSYGHGARGEVWRLSKHLAPLVEMCGRLTAGQRQFILLTCHTPDYHGARLEQLLHESLGDGDPGRIASRALALRTASGRELPSGVAATWERTE